MLLSYLYAITRDANPASPGFQPQAMYLVVCCLYLRWWVSRPAACTPSRA